MQLAAPPYASFAAPSRGGLLPFDAAGQPLGQWQQQQQSALDGRQQQKTEPNSYQWQQQQQQMELYPGSAARLQYSITASRQLLMGLLHPSRSLNYALTPVGQQPPPYCSAQPDPHVPYFDWQGKASILPAVRIGRYGAPPGRSCSGGGLGSGRVLPVGGGPPPLTSADAAPAPPVMPASGPVSAAITTIPPSGQLPSAATPAMPAMNSSGPPAPALAVSSGHQRQEGVLKAAGASPNVVAGAAHVPPASTGIAALEITPGRPLEQQQPALEISSGCSAGEKGHHSISYEQAAVAALGVGPAARVVPAGQNGLAESKALSPSGAGSGS